MRKQLFFLFVSLVMTLSAMADTKQTVKIDGATVEKTVTRMTFNGDNVVLTFSDNSTQTEDMQLVTIEFFYSGTGITDTKADEAQDKRVFNLNGQYMGRGMEGRAKGVYVVEGKKVVVK